MDAELKKQIEERVAYDNYCVEQIKSNPGNCVFRLQIWVEEDNEYFDAGIFTSWQLAEQYALNSSEEYRILKMAVYDKSQEWDEDEWGDSRIATIKYNAEGQVTDYWGDGIQKSIPNRNPKKRFEDAYVPIPHPFKEGDIVYIISMDEVGLVRLYKEGEWKIWEEKIKNWEPDYSDVCFPVEIPNEKAQFGHYHVAPMDVEYAVLEDSDPREKLLRMASCLVKGDAYIQEFQMICEEYIKEQRSPQR